MDVPLYRTVNGCIWWPATVMTLGLTILITRRAERRFILRMDDTGFVTRGGKEYRWDEVTQFRREQTLINGRLAYDGVRIKTARGTVALPLSRTDKPAAVFDYAVRRVPEAALQR